MTVNNNICEAVSKFQKATDKHFVAYWAMVQILVTLKSPRIKGSHLKQVLKSIIERVSKFLSFGNRCLPQCCRLIRI